MSASNPSESNSPHLDSRVSALQVPVNPTDKELLSFVDADIDSLPSKEFKRPIDQRIFVNRDVRLDEIRWVGFDMDYTLAVYLSPAYESLQYNLTLSRLVEKFGYPSELAEQCSYDPSFPVRGTIVDIQTGNLLKVDMFGYILRCIHGRSPLGRKEIRDSYPSGQIMTQDMGRGKRYHLFNTLFELPEIALFADVVCYFERSMSSKERDELCEVQREDPDSRQGISFRNIFGDIRSAIDEIHADGSLKSITIEDIKNYVRRDERLPLLFDRLRKSGKRLFLLTNSEWYYTNALMSFMLGGALPEYENWRKYFDIVIVSARKPTWFGEGTPLREVDVENGHLKFTGVGDKFVFDHVYCGGNYTTFHNMLGGEFEDLRGDQVLYVGDHLFSDVMMSKKNRGLWRTLLIVRELDQENYVWEQHRDMFTHLQNLEFIRAKMFRYFDMEADSPPENFELIRRLIKDSVETFDTEFNNYFGSIFRSGSKTSLFSSEVARYADLYASDVLNLVYYPPFYYFQAHTRLIAHEEECYRLSGGQTGYASQNPEESIHWPHTSS